MDTTIEKPKAMGWLRDLPDVRDYTPEHEKIQPMLKQLHLTKLKAVTLPPTIDLRVWCSVIEDQRDLGSCTAHAGVGLLEFYERKAFGKYLDASRLFLYKTTRNLLGWTGDTGAYLSTTMAAMTLFGVPPERYWPYMTTKLKPSGSSAEPNFDTEPSAFCYAFGQSYQSIDYFRLDPPGLSPADLLTRIKTYLAGNMPSMFGFTVYSSYASPTMVKQGYFPLPCPKEKISGGHAVIAVGYDDNKIIVNPNCGVETIGAFLIRNSWGTNWGDKGYGWLPYDYVLKGLAVDWWVLFKQEYVDTKQFGL